MEAITLLWSDAALENLQTEFSLLCNLYTPLNDIIYDYYFVILFLLAVVPDYCAVASHARAIAVHLFCIASHTVKAELLTLRPSPSGHTWGSKGRTCGSGIFLPACTATHSPLIRAEPLISRFMTSASATHKQTHPPPAVVVEIGKFWNVYLNRLVAM